MKYVMILLFIFLIIYCLIIGLIAFMKYDLEKTSNLIKNNMKEQMITEIVTCRKLKGTEMFGKAIMILEKCIEEIKDK